MKKLKIIDYNKECETRTYKCLGCDFIGMEKSANDHQVICDNPMEQIS